ncbi:lysophospholipid acyltransferase family protein [Propionibacteriaceae bacterium Y1685]
MNADRLVALDPESGTVDADAGRDGEGKGLYWMLRHVVLGPVLRRVFRPIEEGVENVPTDGPAILAINHLSFADWIFMPLALNRRVTFIAKSDYFTGSGVKGWAQRRFFAGTGQVPVDRSGGKASEGALRAGLSILDRGELFGIFPEGTRSHDGRLYKGRTGVARLALASGVPVIPTALVGTDEIAPPGKMLSKIMSPTVKFGAPLDFSRYADLGTDRLVLRSITDEIMDAILQLSGQEYVDEYAPAAKEKARLAKEQARVEQFRAVQAWVESKAPVRRKGDTADDETEEPTVEAIDEELDASLPESESESGSEAEPEVLDGTAVDDVTDEVPVEETFADATLDREDEIEEDPRP